MNIEYPHEQIEPIERSSPGRVAGPIVTFGANNRYSLYPVHTRFARIVWCVDDDMLADTPGGTNIRTAETITEAIKGLK